MDEQPVTYSGLAAMPLNEPVIDFAADDGQVLDLHNGGDVVGIEIEMPADLVVRLTYIEPARWAEGAGPDREVELRFGGVRGLTVTQDEDAPDEASSTFEDLTVWPPPPPRFMLRTGNLAALRRGFGPLEASAGELSRRCFEARAASTLANGR